jgi:hypothetical protein
MSWVLPVGRFYRFGAVRNFGRRPAPADWREESRKRAQVPQPSLLDFGRFDSSTRPSSQKPLSPNGCPRETAAWARPRPLRIGDPGKSGNLCGKRAQISCGRSGFSQVFATGAQGIRWVQSGLFNAWTGLDRREAPVRRSLADFRSFAQSGSNPGHPCYPFRNSPSSRASVSLPRQGSRFRGGLPPSIDTLRGRVAGRDRGSARRRRTGAEAPVRPTTSRRWTRPRPHAVRR